MWCFVDGLILYVSSVTTEPMGRVRANLEARVLPDVHITCTFHHARMLYEKSHCQELSCMTQICKALAALSSSQQILGMPDIHGMFLIRHIVRCVFARGRKCSVLWHLLHPPNRVTGGLAFLEAIHACAYVCSQNRCSTLPA